MKKTLPPQKKSSKKAKQKPNTKAKLIMSFDPHTIEHLGIKMYSNLPNAFAELIANAFDADAKTVHINLYDDAGEKRIEIIDDGDGMDFEEINSKFLRIGRKRRQEGFIKSSSGKRKVTGKKGLGKLAFFGIGNNIEIITTKRKSGIQTRFTLNWTSILSTKGRDYAPFFHTVSCSKKETGTKIILTELKRKTAFDKLELAESISKLFNFFNTKFKVYISLNGDKKILIDNKLKYSSIKPEFEWTFPHFFSKVTSDYEDSAQIKGKVFSTEKPLKPGLRGITLFANGRLVNSPEFFGVSESSHGFSYLTGWLDIDFVDDWADDVISTDRQSLNWDLQQTAILREYLKRTMSELERSWRERRKETRQNIIKSKTNVDIANWFKTLPQEVLSNMEPIISKIINDSELSEGDQSEVIQNLNIMVPSYPYYHWRHLNLQIQEASKADYEKQDYYRAFSEAVKRYINSTRTKSGSTNSTDSGMMGEVFGKNKVLSVTKKFKKPDGNDFTPSTLDNIEDGQKFLSMGILSGVRNPLSHEEISDLRNSKLFTEIDCLDALSLLSHLTRRLDDA